MAASFLSAALKLADRGLQVFPCRPRTKLPATKHGVLDATTNPSAVEKWWRQAPLCNIGVATGTISKIMVVDVDSIDAEAELKKLEDVNGALPATVEAITARGRHLYFKCPDREIRNSAGKIAPGIDIRANGGYALVPPSMHPSGKRYAWSVDSANSFAAAPEWLIDMITAPIADEPAKPPPWAELIRDGAPKGCRNDSMTRIVGHLLQRHVDPLIALEIALAINDARWRPPLPRGEIVQVVDNIAAAELKKRLNA
jgi:hypothetical protein